jgi:DNA/RNA-binding domain of Phe-tRNA-synthetase-like protein
MDRKPSLRIDPSLEPSPVRAAIVWALGLPACPPSAAAPGFVLELLARVRGKGAAFIASERKAAVRDMLRHGKYKPAGRSKPSSEYLLAAALEAAEPGSPAGTFPLVNGPVDINNAVSLEWGYPASIFDAAKTGFELVLRRGQAGESYVFNPSGQLIELEDLLCVCALVDGAWKPCGNPVKDAMATKVFEGARDVLAVVYAPASDPGSELEACAARFAELLAASCGPESVGWSIA